MRRLLIATFIFLSILIVAERLLYRRQEARYIQAGVLRPLVSPQEVSVNRVAQFQIVPGETGVTWTYRLHRGTWRYPALFDAYVLPDRVQWLLGGILRATGTVVSADPRAAPHYGLTPEQALGVCLTDASGTPLLKVWVGRSAPGRNSDESYVKKAGSDTLYHVHVNPYLALGPMSGVGRPPLIDPYVLPRALSRKPIVRIVYEADGYPLETLRSVETAPASPSLPGSPPQGPTYAWYGTFNGEKKACNISSVFAYINFLSRLRYSELRDPRAGGDYGFERARRKLYLEDKEGIVDTLEVGDREAGGNFYLRHRTAGQVFTLASQKVGLLFPTAKALLDSLPKASPYELAESSGPQMPQ